MKVFFCLVDLKHLTVFIYSTNITHLQARQKVIKPDNSLCILVGDIQKHLLFN